MEAILEYLNPLLETYAGSHGYVVQVLVWVGTFRAVLKPMQPLLAAVVKATPTQEDDKLFNALVESRWYKGFVFAVDYLFSIKMPK